MSYYRASEEFKGYANSFQAIAKPGLESITALLNNMGNPQDKLSFVHVAGTNGKGSVCEFLRTMLTHAGYKTGIYTSPNMFCVNERINIDGANISDENLKKLLEEVEPKCVKTKEQIGVYPTQFEIWTAMAMKYFCDNNCDIVVLETGLGGRLDATNIVKTTRLSVITHIALDHMQYLGDTTAKIAAEKAGIIKPDTDVVSAFSDSEAAAVIENACKERSCRLTMAEKFKEGRHDGIYEIICGEEFEGVKLSLGGINQLDNASCAVSAAKILNLPHESIKFGLENTAHMGRFEKIRENLYFDGAHNPDGISALKKNLGRYFPNSEKVYIIATMADKDISASLKLLQDGRSEIMAVAVENNERSMSACELAKRARSLGFDASAYDNIADACRGAVMRGKLTVVCGSLYLYADLINALKKENS